MTFKVASHGKVKCHGCGNCFDYWDVVYWCGWAYCDLCMAAVSDWVEDNSQVTGGHWVSQIEGGGREH